MQLRTHCGSHDNFTCMYCMHTYPLIQCTYTSNGGITCTVHVLIPIYTPCVRVSMYTIVTVVLLYRTCTHTHIHVYLCVRVSKYTIERWYLS